MWLTSPNIACTHGFSTRHGGVSKSPFLSLNLGGNDDDNACISTNRQLALQHLNLNSDSLCYLKQVHGNVVREAAPGQQEGDALVSNKTGLTLAISIADCYPILFFDEKNAVIGAAHAGWRGTVSGIAGNVVKAMQKLGAEPQHINVAIGQGICRDKFNVGDEVTDSFRKEGFPETFLKDNKIDLVKCNIFVLKENHIPEKNIWAMNRCTFENDFYSYRRDKGITGRMWGLIALK